MRNKDEQGNMGQNGTGFNSIYFHKSYRKRNYLFFLLFKLTTSDRIIDVSVGEKLRNEEERLVDLLVGGASQETPGVHEPISRNHEHNSRPDHTSAPTFSNLKRHGAFANLKEHKTENEERRYTRARTRSTWHSV